MRQLILLIILLSICNPCLGLGQVKFKDMPEKHWAQSAVYDLVKRGITNGFPDGTYQGMRNMTRYEMAAFLSKIEEKGTNMAAVEKLTAELKTELQTVKYELENPDNPKISARFEERLRLCNISLNNDGPHGPRLDYRLKLSAEKNFSPTRTLKINLDTMDSGFNGGTPDLAMKLIDIEGKIKAGIFYLKAAAGPGTVYHAETGGTIPSDNYYVYDRSKPSVSVSTSLKNFDLALAYVARKVQPWGTVEVSEITGTVAYTYNALPVFGKTKLALTPRFLSSGSDKDTRAEIMITSAPLPVLSGELLYGIGNTNSASGSYAKAAVTYSNSNTKLCLNAHKVGSVYRQAIDKYEFISLNNFNKLILDGSVDVGLEFIQKLNNVLKLRFTSDAALASDLKYGTDHPGTSITNELALSSDNISLFYRSYFVPSGVSSADPALAKNISTSSDLIGMTFSIVI